MLFSEKMNKINDLYKKAINNNDFEKVSSISIGAFEIASKQFPKEFTELLAKYKINEDLKQFREKNQKLFNYVQSFHFDMPNFQIILIKNNKEVLIPFFNINDYIKSKKIKDELELFICTILFTDESNFQAFQLFHAVELLHSIKTK